MPPTQIRIILIPFKSHWQEWTSTQTSSWEALHCENVLPRMKFYADIFFLRSVTLWKLSPKRDVLLRHFFPETCYIAKTFSQEWSSTQTSSSWDALRCENFLPRRTFYSGIFFLRRFTLSKRSPKNFYSYIFFPRSLTLWKLSCILKPFSQEGSSTQTSSSREALHCETLLPRRNFYSDIFFPRSLTLWNSSPRKEVLLRHFTEKPNTVKSFSQEVFFLNLYNLNHFKLFLGLVLGGLLYYMGKIMEGFLVVFSTALIWEKSCEVNCYPKLQRSFHECDHI